MRQVILYITISMDGYIARSDGSVDWLGDQGSLDLGDYGLSRFLEQIDTIIMGKASYKQLLTFGEWDFGEQDTYVFSSQDFPTSTERTYVVSENHIDFVKTLLNRDGKNIWCFGGGKLNYFMLHNGFINDIMLFQQPKILGKGIGLFGEEELETQTFARQFVRELPGDITLIKFVKIS